MSADSNENELDNAWGSALEGELAALAPAAAEPSEPPKSRRGRPVGTGGSRFLRNRMRQEAEESVQAVPEPAAPQLHELSTQALQTQRQENDRLKEMFGPMRFLKNVGSSFQRVVSEALVQSVDVLVRTARTRGILKADTGTDSKSKSSVPKAEAETLAPKSVNSIVYGKALTMSASALTALDKGCARELSKSTVQSRMVHAGALALECSAVMCSSALSSVIDACSKVPNMKPLLFLWRVRYDETPSRVRVANLAAQAGVPLPQWL